MTRYASSYFIGPLDADYESELFYGDYFAAAPAAPRHPDAAA
jgi:hypothetical protein